MQQGPDKLLIILNSGISKRQLYFGDHPHVQANSKSFMDELKLCLAASRQNSLFIGVVDGKYVYEGRFLVGPSIAGRKLIDFVGKMQGGGLVFRTGTTGEEVRRLFSLAAGLQESVSDLDTARRLMTSEGIENIEIAPPYAGPDGVVSENEHCSWQGEHTNFNRLRSPILLYQALFDVVEESHGRAAHGQALDIDHARTVSENLLESARHNFMDMMQLVQYPDFESYTVGHSVRVATLAVLVGQSLGLDHEVLLELGTAGLLHDVGKSKIPEEILFKTGILDQDERRIMESHAHLGAQILLEHKNTNMMAVAAAWGHHLRHDLGGYPAPPPWAARSQVTALMQVCDVFEALTAIRPYKPPMTPRHAYEIMLKDEGAFDPKAFSVFVKAMGLYPPGNRVRLSDGSQGTVIAVGQDIEKPQVQITQDSEGHQVSDLNYSVVDLSADQNDGLAVAELLLEPQ